MKNASIEFSSTSTQLLHEIVLGVTGSIAAYKAAELTRLMVKEGWGVNVVMTKAATEFVTPLTFQTLSRRKVMFDMFAPIEDWKPEHVSLGQLAEVMVVAPCTANVLAKLAHGLADDMLTATALACRGALVVAPAMNDAMFENAATQENLETLRRRGVTIVSPGKGELACGTVGRGRMAEPEEIIVAVRALLSR